MLARVIASPCKETHVDSSIRSHESQHRHHERLPSAIILCGINPCTPGLDLRSDVDIKYDSEFSYCQPPQDNNRIIKRMSLHMEGVHNPNEGSPLNLGYRIHQLILKTSLPHIVLG